MRSRGSTICAWLEAIYTRITEVRAAADAAGQSKVDFFGAPPALRTPYPRVETVGAPVFEWDGGNPYRIAALYRVLGYRGIVAVTPSERARLLPQFAAMPAWPAPDSVRWLVTRPWLNWVTSPAFTMRS